LIKSQILVIMIRITGVNTLLIGRESGTLLAILTIKRGDL